MINRRLLLSTVTAAFVLGTGITSARAEAKEKVTNTTVTVGHMCSGCVKTITTRFKREKSVNKIECDIDAKTVTLTPAKDVKLSSLAVWEIFEKIRKKPTKLVGPDGTFTSKPKKS
ncbi:MAG: heavy-metal-associated domain-containing protein [Planctomycetota bacterium]